MPRSTWEHAQGSAAPFGYGTITLSGQAFQACSPRRRICNSPQEMRLLPGMPHDPRCATDAPLTHTGFRLFPFRSPLLGESRLLSVPRGTKMFQFPRLPSHCLCIQQCDSRILLRPGCPIRVPPDRSLLAAPRGLSQLAAPFVGPWRQGIHRMLLVA